MRKHIRTTAALKVAQELIPAETAVDEALIRLSSLQSAMLSARLDANLAVSVGQPALTALNEAMTMMMNARERVVETHRHLALAKDQIGLRTLGFGDPGCPDNKAESDESNVISLVA